MLMWRRLAMVIIGGSLCLALLIAVLWDRKAVIVNSSDSNADIREQMLLHTPKGTSGP
ncbi:MAG TPA: hypothetical protein VFB80_03335 [Pirellulaceae bacterium]|nr:hypothetical protein [Pirellulaceae bacterium]